MQTIASLNEQYAAPGRIAFREGPSGYPVAVLVAPAGVCEVSIYGGQVLSYRPVGHQPVLYLSPQAEYESGKAIRGGIPVCWPWFGQAPDGFPEGSPAHGFVRKTLWHVLTTSYTGEQTEIELGLTHRQAASKAWPWHYMLRLKITVGSCLELELQTRNIDQKVFTYSDCFHAYLAVPDVSRAVLHGLSDTDYTEPPARILKREAGPLAFAAEVGVDRIYRQPGEVNLALRDQLLERTIRIVAEDTDAVVVWHPPEGTAINDLPPEGARHFICVEPANPHHEPFTPVTLLPGETHYTTMRLQAVFFGDEEQGRGF